MRSRLKTYEDILLYGLDSGYIFTSIRSFYNTYSSNTKVIVLRHDIDSDIRTTRKIFQIEKKYHINASYYFRLSTLDFNLMREIEEYGSEASYHYEEIATFAKKYNIRTAEEIRNRLPEIKKEFLINLNFIQDHLKQKIKTVASHGDFANRQLNIINNEILQDQDFRKSCGIEYESYDKKLLDYFDIYISDKPYPQYYYPISPFEAIKSKNKIYFLTHPSQWETNWLENTKINLKRFYEGLMWKQSIKL